MTDERRLPPHITEEDVRIVSEIAGPVFFRQGVAAGSAAAESEYADIFGRLAATDRAWSELKSENARLKGDITDALTKLDSFSWHRIDESFIANIRRGLLSSIEEKS